MYFIFPQHTDFASANGVKKLLSPSRPGFAFALWPNASLARDVDRLR